MKKTITAGIISAFAIALLLSCQTSGRTYSSSSRSSSQPAQTEESLKRAVNSRPNDPNAHYELGNYYRNNNKRVLAALSFENALALDPSFRHNASVHYTPTTAANFGIQTSENLNFGNYSLYFLLGAVYFDAANGAGANTDNVVPLSEKQITFEKALAAFRSGYEIDIVNENNADKNMHAVYLALISRTLVELGRYNEAVQFYQELADVTNITSEIQWRISSATFSGPSYYVSARGSDENDGLSEDSPLRSLSLAYERANAGTIKRITVIGTLNYLSEAKRGGESSVFSLNASGTTQVLITGKWGSERSVLSGAGSNKSVVYVGGGNARFEAIEISGGELNENDSGGYGISVFGTVIIGQRTVVRANKGSGVNVSASGACTIAGGEIRDNESSGVTNFFGTLTLQSGTIGNNKNNNNGGGVSNLGTFTMSGGNISGNSTDNSGGGVYNTGTFTMTGGNISNNTAKASGGGVYVAAVRGYALGEGLFTMRGGTISDNTANYAGGVYLIDAREGFEDFGGIFIQSGGTISNNKALQAVGGILVGRTSRYEHTGGTVTGNTSTMYLTNQLPGSSTNITRMPGSR